MLQKNFGMFLLCVALAVSLVISLFTQRSPSRVQAQSPVAPILVVVNENAPNPFGRYLGEILAAEGVNAYEFIELSQLTASDLANHTVTILAETPLTADQATLFINHVAAGGRLIAMRPDTQIRSLFGLNSLVSNASGAYIGIENNATWQGSKPGQGLPSETLQIHTPVDNYSLAGNGILLARLYQGPSTSTGYPAVAANSAGNAVAFTYDLARNVVYTRQGNPQNAGIDADGDGVVTTTDLFQTQGGGAPWVNRSRIPIPQADVQQRYFVRLLRQLFQQSAPLPQLWYFPDGAKTVLVLTADAHANPTSYYQYQIDSLAQYDAKLTFYLAIGGEPTDETVQAWRAQGHEFGIHPYAYRPDSYPPYNITNLAEGYSAKTTWFANTYSSPPSRTVRNHQVAWWEWTGAAAIAASHGYAMDTSFYHWGPWLKQANGQWPHGYITGSGQPMRFVTQNGVILPIYQQLTQLVDEHLFGVPPLENLTLNQAIAVSQTLIDRSLAGDYAALMAQIHVDLFGDGKVGPWAMDTIHYAQQKNVPVMNADRWLTFVEARDASAFSNMNWNATTKTLDFTVTLAGGGGTDGNDELGILLPISYAGEAAHSVWVNDVAQGFDTISVSNRDYALVKTLPGTKNIRMLYSGALPTNTPTSTPTPTFTPIPTSTPTPTPTVTPTIVEPGESITHATYADFTQPCVSHQATWPRLLGNGGVRLAGAQHDGFGGGSLNGDLWSFGSWNEGNFAPIVSNGVLRLPAGNGGWVRSTSTFTHAIMEAQVAFATAPWQHIGFGSDGFMGNQFILFSTYQGDGNLYARVNNNATEQRINLGAIPQGYQHYRIEWSTLNSTTDRARFYMNGQEVASLQVARNGLSGLYAYFSNNHLQDANNAALNIQAVSVSPPNAPSGIYRSCVHDAGPGYRWTSVGWTKTLVEGTNLQAQMRHSVDGVVWHEWESIDKGVGSAEDGFVFEVGERYMQYRFIFTTSNQRYTPVLNTVTLNAEIDTGIRPTPTPTLTFTPTPTPTHTPTHTPTYTPTGTPTSTDIPNVTPTPTQIGDADTATPTPTPSDPDSEIPIPTPTGTLVPAGPDTLTPSPTAPGQGGNPTHPHRLHLPVLERR